MDEICNAMNRSRIRIALLGLLAFGYAAQLFSPLRTNTDATCYLEMAASASDGAGFVCCENAKHYPVGYPAILACLDRAGIACSSIIIGLNLIALTVGLIAAAYLLRESFGWTSQAILLAAIATLLNWVVIKHVTLPITDTLFFGLSLACLACLTHASKLEYPEKLTSLMPGLALLLASILVRTVGITLIPAFLFAALNSSTVIQAGRAIGKNRIALIGLAAGICLIGLAGVAVIARTNYFREMLENRVDVIALATLRLDDWGELILNSSMAKLPRAMRSLSLIAGVLGASLLAFGFARRRRIQAIDIYLAAYLAILFAWPYRDARFWIPVLPLMLGHVAAGYQRLVSNPLHSRLLLPVYGAVYTLLGLVAIGYSTWLSFSGDRFGDRFAGGVYAGSYREAFGHRSDSPNGHAKVDPQIARLLERYQLARPSIMPKPALKSASLRLR
ncbi:MAG: hypothetical protein ABS79_04165 [Planctomycetes bacterium SCN 63-9]|nr:MAG: hypothetical protein ABS79_04165 [Planctomycetes bacterium SCN 63-9]